MKRKKIEKKKFLCVFMAVPCRFAAGRAFHGSGFRLHSKGHRPKVRRPLERLRRHSNR